MLNAACKYQFLPQHPTPMNDNLDLQNDLQLGPSAVTGLCVSESQISTQYQGTMQVIRPDATTSKTVGDVTNLVWRRANGIPT
jgi:hypothetical protein